VALGGAVAEELILGNRNTGSAGDFEQAAQLAERMVLAGMSRLGIVHKDRLPPNVLHDEIQAILHQEEQRVRAWLADHRDALIDLAKRLLEDEKLAGDELRARLARSQAAAAPVPAGGAPQDASTPWAPVPPGANTPWVPAPGVPWDGAPTGPWATA